MKTIKLLAIMAGLSFAGITTAQTINGPAHPLNPQIGQPRVLADTMHLLVTVQSGSYAPDSSVAHYHDDTMVYGHDATGLIDTLRSSHGGWVIKKYSKSDQLLSTSTFTTTFNDIDNPGKLEEEWIQDEYEYGDDGRILTQKYYKPFSTILYSIYTYNYTMTDSSYIVDEWEYFLDNKGRLIHQKNLQEKDEYATDSTGRKYRIGDSYITYHDNGYTIYGASRRENMFLSAKNAWVRSTYTFQKDGYLSRKETYIKEFDDANWKIYTLEDYIYAYGKNNPQSIAPIAASSKVYAAGGSITIEAEKAATVSVYTFGGQMLKQQTIAAGTTQIPMAKGLYIVTVNGEGYKVLVK